MSTSVFEIIGPVMVGPSSSHTAGMARIGMMTHRIINEKPKAIRLVLSPKLRTTYSGHRTDAALFGGTLGYKEDGPQLRDAIRLAHEQGISTAVDFLPEGKYPQNTAKIIVTCGDGKQFSVLGTSVGGGSIVISEVDGAAIRLSPDAWHVIVWGNEALPQSLCQGVISCQSGQGANGYVVALTYLKQPSPDVMAALAAVPGVAKMSLVQPVLAYGVSLPGHKIYSSCKQACEEAAEQGVSLAEIAITYEMSRSGFSREAVVGRMHEHLERMRLSVEQGFGENKLLYGLASGKDARLLLDAVAAGKTISGGIIPEAVAMALGVMELNGSMGCIVAAPTAGSSGIVPGCMMAIQKKHNLTDNQLVDALFVSALLGVIMAERDISYSGSVGGCQAEIGISSAIAAAGLASLFSDDPNVIVHAMALCMKNLLGLVCDPIAGPIEVPCIKRNAVGVANAFISADMALSGIKSFIPPDEVLDALLDVEKRLPPELKCATIGGLACTHTAKCVRERLAGDCNSCEH